MNINAADLAGKKCGTVYEKQNQPSFFDRLVFYIDGRILFERYIHGEAAGLVFSAWADGFDENAKPLWKSEARIESQNKALPQKLTFTSPDRTHLEFDDDSYRFFLKTEELKSDRENGYGFFKLLRCRRDVSF